MTDERSVAAPGSLGRKVFVIHGRDKQARHEVYIFLRAIGLDPIEWHEALDIAGGGAPFIGDVLDAVLKSHGAFLVLLTPDDVVRLKREHADDDEDVELKPSGQARPNVLFEAGMALALAPNRTVLVEFGKVRPFTDIGGRFIVKLDGTTQKRHTLAQRLKSIGCDVKLDGNDWHSAGNLTPPVKSAPTQPSDSASERPSEAAPGKITGDPCDRKQAFDKLRERKKALRPLASTLPNPLEQVEPEERYFSGRWRGRLSTVLRWRIVVVFIGLLTVAAVTLFRLGLDDTSPDTDASSDKLPNYRPTGSRSEQVDNLVKPPSLVDGIPPDDTGNPDDDYQQHTECVVTVDDGQFEYQMPWGQETFNFAQLHTLATGRGQIVAVIDTGVNPHPLFQQRLRQGHDYVSSGGSRDCDGQGTQVAGLIAAAPASMGRNTFQGVAPQAGILAVRQSSANFGVGLQADGKDGTAGTLNTLAQAIIGAANADANVIAITVGYCRLASLGPITLAEQTVQTALYYAIEVKDAVVVAAAGDTSDCQNQNNDNPNRPTVIPIPAWFSDDVLTVAASTRTGDTQGSHLGVASDRVATFSVRGPWVSVAAPGTEITTLDPASNSLAVQQWSGDKNGYVATSIEGTSYAAAYVAGLAALVREHRPDLNARQVMNRIEYTAEHPAAAGGWNDRVGFGEIQPIDALTATVPHE